MTSTVLLVVVQRTRTLAALGKLAGTVTDTEGGTGSLSLRLGDSEGEDTGSVSDSGRSGSGRALGPELRPQGLTDPATQAGSERQPGHCCLGARPEPLGPCQ
jgi:hypothetical protein